MGLFKSMKDMAEITKDATKLRDQQLEQQGYKKGMRGQMSQMGDMLSDSKEMLSDMTGKSGDRERILSEGLKGEGVIVGMGTPERGATWFNLNIDLEVHVSGKDPYKVNNMYMVPAAAQLGQGVKLPIAVDPGDPAKIAIDWERAPTAPVEGQVRPAGTPAQPSMSNLSSAASGWSNINTNKDPVEKLEKLAQLKESGALSDAEFEAQKAKILGE